LKIGLYLMKRSGIVILVDNGSGFNFINLKERQSKL